MGGLLTVETNLVHLSSGAFLYFYDRQTKEDVFEHVTSCLAHLCTVRPNWRMPRNVAAEYNVLIVVTFGARIVHQNSTSVQYNKYLCSKCVP